MLTALLAARAAVPTRRITAVMRDVTFPPIKRCSSGPDCVDAMYRDHVGPAVASPALAMVVRLTRRATIANAGSETITHRNSTVERRVVCTHDPVPRHRAPSTALAVAGSS